MSKLPLKVLKVKINNTITGFSHACFGCEEEVGTNFLFILRSVQIKHKSWRNNSKSYQFNSLWVMPTMYLWASASLLFHWQKQLSKFTVCYGDHLCSTEERSTTASNVWEKKKKIQGISFKTKPRLQRGEVMGWTLSQKTNRGRQKPLSPGGEGY